MAHVDAPHLYQPRSATFSLTRSETPQPARKRSLFPLVDDDDSLEEKYSQVVESLHNNSILFESFSLGRTIATMSAFLENMPR